MSNDPSPDVSATQKSSGPATGTPAPGSATPPVAALTLEEALKKLADLEHAHGNATEEVERHRKKLSAYEKAEKEREAAKKAAEEAQLSEIERITKQHTELQAQHTAMQQQMQHRLVSYEVERQASKLGIIDPDAAAKLLDWNELEYDENGIPSNAAKVLEKLVKSKPYLAPTQPQQPPEPSAQPAASVRSAPTIPAMNPGRTTIASPGVRTPGGKPPRLSDPGVLTPPGTVSKYQP